MAISVAVFVRNQLNLAALNRLQSFRGQLIHLEEPLCGEFWLDDCIGAFRIPYRRSVFFDLHKVSSLFEHFDDVLTRLETVLTYQNLSLFVQTAVIVNNIHYRQIVAQSDLIVMGVVCRRNLKAACSEVHFHIVVLYHRYLSVDQRDEHLFAMQAEMPFVLGIDADGSIGHNSFRTGCGYYQIIVGGIAFSV